MHYQGTQYQVQCEGSLLKALAIGELLEIAFIFTPQDGRGKVKDRNFRKIPKLVEI